jgi:hypothetical protein
MKRTPWLLTASIVLIISGCTTFQSPKVLAKNERSLAVGASMALGTIPLFVLHVDFRTYVAENLDAGIRLTSGILESHSAVIDAKYQLLTEPFFLALSTGAGIYEEYDTFSTLVQVLLIGGTETFYIGVKPMMLFNNIPPSVKDGRMQDIPPVVFVGICSGLMLGSKKGLNIETNLLFVDLGSLAALPSLGVGWRFFF